MRGNGRDRSAIAFIRVHVTRRRWLRRMRARCQRSILRFTEASSAAVRNRVPTKLDEPRLIGMKIQSKTSEPRLEIGKELLRFVPVLEANDRVVRVAHDNHVAGSVSLSPLVDPLIIDMMEVVVRQERADDRALRRPFLHLDHASIFEHACRQPFGNQPDDSPVANPMLDEADQPLPADLVEGRHDRLPISAMSRIR